MDDISFTKYSTIENSYRQKFIEYICQLLSTKVPELEKAKDTVRSS